MGLYDDLKTWLRGAQQKAATEAGKAAARQTVKKAQESVEAAGDEFLDFAERELDTAKKAREGRTEVTPSHEEADAIAARVLAAADDSSSARELLRGRKAEADDPEAKAREELARMKADLKKQLYGEE